MAARATAAARRTTSPDSLGWREVAVTLGVAAAFIAFVQAAVAGTTLGPSGTDAAAVVAQARALPDPTMSAYLPLKTLYPLIGIDWQVAHGNPHLPMEFALFLPLAWIPYSIWFPVWGVLMGVAIAWSLRFLAVPPVYAYPIAVIFCLTEPGRLSLGTTYPLLAIALAVAWRFRDRPLVSGFAAAVFGCGRTTGLILLAYFPLTRRWRALAWAIGLLIALLAVALALEPTVVRDLLTTGASDAAYLFTRSDNLGLSNAMRQAGISPWVAYAVVAVCAVLAYRVRDSRFWVLAWLSMAISPVAWSYSVAQGVPLAAYLWGRGMHGRLAVMGSVAGLMTTSGNLGISWVVFIATSGAGLVADSVIGSTRASDAPRG